MQKPEWLKELNRAKVRAFLKTDRAVLIACMGAALLFWVINRLNQNFRMEFIVPIVYEMPKGMINQFRPPQQVRVLVSGKGWTLLAKKLNSANHKLTISVEPGTQEVIISASQLRNKLIGLLGQYEEILSLSLDQIVLRTDREARKMIDLHLLQEIQCSKGYQLSAPIQLNIGQVEVTGPKSIIDTLNDWMTDTLKVSDISKTQTFDLKLKKHANGMVQFHLEKDLEATIYVEQSTEKKFLVRLSETNIPEGYRIFPDVINITCNVAISHFNEATAEDLHVTLRDYTGKGSADKVVLPVIVSSRHIATEVVDFRPRAVTLSKL